MKTENTIIFELARTLWVTENIKILPSDAAERKTQWHSIKSDYIGKARALVMQLEKRGIHLEREQEGSYS